MRISDWSSDVCSSDLQRVLSGLFKRVDGATIAAALWYCDLRGVTSMSEALPRDEVIATLNDWFGAMAEPVHAHGGEVLKFIGDAMLAIFPIADDLDRDRACHTALNAAQAALAGLDQLNQGRVEAGKPSLERSEEHTSELQSLMRISYAVFCWKKKKREIKSNTYKRSALK